MILTFLVILYFSACFVLGRSLWVTDLSWPLKIYIWRAEKKGYSIKTDSTRTTLIRPQKQNECANQMVLFILAITSTIQLRKRLNGWIKWFSFILVIMTLIQPRKLLNAQIKLFWFILSITTSIQPQKWLNARIKCFSFILVISSSIQPRKHLNAQIKWFFFTLTITFSILPRRRLNTRIKYFSFLLSLIFVSVLLTVISDLVVQGNQIGRAWRPR